MQRVYGLNGSARATTRRVTRRPGLGAVHLIPQPRCDTGIAAVYANVVPRQATEPCRRERVPTLFTPSFSPRTCCCRPSRRFVLKLTAWTQSVGTGLHPVPLYYALPVGRGTAYHPAQASRTARGRDIPAKRNGYSPASPTERLPTPTVPQANGYPRDGYASSQPAAATPDYPPRRLRAPSASRDQAHQATGR